jgi:PAS domain S-box-containing protein
MASLQDVTDLRQAEVTQRAGEERYQTFYENSRDAVYITTRDGTYVDANRAALDLFGYTRAEMKKVKALQLYADPADARRLQDEIEKKGFAQDFEVRLRKKDGTEMDCLFSITALRGDDGSILEFQGIARDVTERKRTDQALRKSEAKYRNIFDSMLEGYFEVDLTGNFTFFNEAVSKFFGYSHDKLMGLNYQKFTSPEEAQRLFDVFIEVYKTGNPHEIDDYEIIKKDGSVGIAEFSVSLLRNAAGEPISFRGVTRDVTERKRVEKAFLESEKKYRTILETMEDGYYELDLAGNFSFVNDAACRHLGYTKEELIGMNNRAYTNPETAKKIYKIFDAVYKEGNSSKIFDYEVIRKDGSTITLELSVCLMRDAQGKPIGFRGVSRDVTERKMAEEALRQSEEKYRTIIENIQDGYFETDLAGRYTFVNDAICKRQGYSKEELIGMNNRQFQDEINAKKTYQAYHRLYLTGEPIEALDIEVSRRDGTKGISESSVSLIRDAQGKPIGFRGVSRDVTERKQAEEKLRQSEEKYRTILEDIKEGYFELDLAGNYTFANEANCKYLGYTKEELIGMSGRRHTDEETAKKVYQLYYELYRTGKPIEMLELECIKKDGTKAIYETSVFLIKDAKGKRTGFRGISRDITGRKLAEEALRRNEERYRTILETMYDGYFEVDLAGNFTFVNDAQCRMSGSLRERLIGKNNREYTTKEEAKQLYETFSSVYKTGEPVKEFAFEFTKRDGTKAFNEISVFLMRDAEGKPIGFRGMSRDVTERKQAEEALRRSEEKYRTILETMQEAYYELDLEGNFTLVNDKVCKDLGYAKEELIGTNSRQYRDGKSDEKIYQLYNELYKTGEPIRALEVEYISKDGTKGTYELSASLIRNAEGKPTGFRGVSRDVTERKKAEEQLKRYAAELERSNEEVKNFAYIVSHDLRVPLVNLKGYTSELRSALGVIGSNFEAALPHLIDEKRTEVAMALHEDVPEALEFITNSVSRMDSFINSILILSRLGRQDLKPEPIDMNALVKTTVETMSHQIQEQGIEVHVGSLPRVVADRTSMEQIMGNILSNAVKYPDSSRPCRIEVAAEANNGETIFTIRDTGRGIAAEDMHKVFAPFRRAGKQDTQGEGMGLAYVQTMVRRHGGRIWCESEPGKGTTFAFTISSTFKQGASDA